MLRKLNDLKSVPHFLVSPLLNQIGAVGGEVDPTKQGQDTTLKIELDGEEKTFTAEDVKSLVNQQSAATQKTQEVAEILNLANRYKLEPKQLAENFEGMAGIFNELIDSGVIDEQGNVLKKQEPAEKPANDPNLKDLFKSKGSEPTSKQDLVALKALIDPVMDKMTKLEEDNTLLMRLRLQDTMQAKFPNLVESDAAKVFSLAERDRSKSILQHAEDVSKEKAEEIARLELEFAKKHGIDLEKVKEQKLFEQDPAGGAATLFPGKKLSFKAKSSDSNAVTPRQATQEFFNRKS